MTEPLASPDQSLSISVRLNGELVRLAGRARMNIQLADSATVADLIDSLSKQEPTLADHLARAVPVVGGRHATSDQALADGQEVALLMPVAGG